MCRGARRARRAARGGITAVVGHHDRIAHAAGGITLDHHRIGHGIRAIGGIHGQGEDRDRCRTALGEAAEVGHLQVFHLRTQRIGQLHGCRGRAIGHDDGQRVGERIALDHGGTAGRVGGLGDRDRWRNRVAGGTRAAIGRRIAATAGHHHLVSDITGRRGQHIHRVDNGVDAISGVCRQGEGRHSCRATLGEAAQVGDLQVVHLRTQGVRQHQRLHGRAVGNAHGEGVGQCIARCHRRAADRVDGLGYRNRRQQHRDIGIRRTGDGPVRIVRESLRTMGQGGHICQRRAGTGIHGHPETQIHLLILGQHAARGGIGTRTHPEHHTVVACIEFRLIVAAAIAARRRRTDSQSVVAMDAQRAGQIGGAGRNGVGQHHPNRAILSGVAELDGVLQRLAGLHVGGTGPTHVADRLLHRRQHERGEQVGDEHQRVREVDVTRGCELQIGCGGIVRHARAGAAAGNIDHLEIDGEVVGIRRVAAGEQRPQMTDAAVPEVVVGALRVGQATPTEDAGSGQVETVTSDAVVAFPYQGTHVGIEAARGRGEQAADRCRSRIAIGHLQRIAGVEHHQPAKRLAAVLVGDDQRPATEQTERVTCADGGSQATDRIAAAGSDQRGDITIGSIRPSTIVALRGECVDVRRIGSELLVAAAGYLEVDVATRIVAVARAT